MGGGALKDTVVVCSVVVREGEDVRHSWEYVCFALFKMIFTFFFLLKLLLFLRKQLLCDYQAAAITGTSDHSNHLLRNSLPDKIKESNVHMLPAPLLKTEIFHTLMTRYSGELCTEQGGKD